MSLHISSLQNLMSIYTGFWHFKIHVIRFCLFQVPKLYAYILEVEGD
uniref:Uncharacterized protein n=1 Tax=Rhizophora mucronata TaxID=61149 RepID=A0A2P2PYW2_RHIMU